MCNLSLCKLKHVFCYCIKYKVPNIQTTISYGTLEDKYNIIPDINPAAGFRLSLVSLVVTCITTKAVPCHYYLSNANFVHILAFGQQPSNLDLSAT